MVSLKLNRPISISWLPRRQRDRRPRFCRQTLPPRFVHSKLLAEKVGVNFEISLFSKTGEIRRKNELLRELIFLFLTL